MRRGGIVFAGPAAIAAMIFYYLIPFLIVVGAPDFISRLRPFLIIGSSVLLIGFRAVPIIASETIRSSQIQADSARALVFSACRVRLDLVSSGDRKLLGEYSRRMI
jgi:hypothetical protein